MKSYFYIILLLLFLTVNSLTSTNIEYIIDAGKNGTGPSVNLEDLNDEFAYFSFDFLEHSQIIPESKDIAFFKFSSDIELIKDNSISYLLDVKEWDQITINEIKNKTWIETKIEYKEKSYDITNYYYKFKRDNNSSKTLLIRVATNGVKEGQLNAENIPSIPSKKSGAKNIQITKLICLFLLILNLW